MRKKIIAITAATLLLATACGCESQQEPDSTTAKTPDASAQQAKPQQQTTEKTAQSFVDEFNANSSTQITDVEKFTPSDANGPYYRTEYRTGVHQQRGARVAQVMHRHRRGGISTAAVSAYKLPQPDALIGRTRGWLPETIDRWNASRPGRGVGGGRPRKRASE